MADLILFHGTSGENGHAIEKDGFIQGSPTWEVQSKPGFIYLSRAYAPFYCTAQHDSDEAAIVKVSVPEEALYPDDDFIMTAMGKPVYTQEDLNMIDFERVKEYAPESLAHMGNACARIADITVLGVSYFAPAGLWRLSDPSITPMNYLVMGAYYRELTEALFDGGMEAAKLISASRFM